MAEEKRTDFSEADLVMQQLRAQLEADRGITAESAPADAPVEVLTQEDAEPAKEALSVIEEAPVEAPEVTADGAEEPPVEALVQEDAEPAKEALSVIEDAPVEAPEVTADGAEIPLIEDDAPLEVVEAEVEVAVAQASPKRKKRLRIPRFDRISHMQAPAPLDSTAREEKKKRAAALASEAEDSLYWQQTPVGRAPYFAPQRGISVVPAAAQKDRGTPTPKWRVSRDKNAQVVEEVLGLARDAQGSAPAAQAPALAVAPAMESEAPVVEKAAPAVEKAAPVVEKATPAVEKAAPVVEKAAPAVEEVAPDVKEVAPAVQASVPAAQELSPAVGDNAASSGQGAPAVTPAVREIAADRDTAAREEDPHGMDFLHASRRRGLRGRAMREKMARKADENAGVTVEQLLSDIFGQGQGLAGNAWLSAAAAESVAPAVGDDTSAPDVPMAEAPVYDAPDGDAPTVTLGGQALVLPDEEALAKGQRVTAPDADDAQSASADSTAEPAPDASESEGQTPLFSAFSVRRRRDGVLPRPRLVRRSADQLAFERQFEQSEQELELLVDLDYEEELGEVIGFEKIKAYHERRLNGKIERRSAHRRHKQKYEYTAHAHDIGLSKFYAKQRRAHIITLTIMAFLLLVLFMFERVGAIRSFFGETAGAMHEPLYLAVGLLLFLVGVFLLRRHLIDGMWQLLCLTPNDNSICAVVVLVTFCYHVVLFFVPLEGAMTLFLSPAMAHLCLLSLSQFFNWYREFSAFRVVSSKQQKYALLPRVSVGGKEGSARERLFENEKHTRVWYVRPVGFIRDYFANTRKRTNHQHALGAQLLLLSALSVALALLATVLGRSLADAVHIAFVCFLLSVPAVSVLLTSLPMFCGTCLCLGRRGAIIGEQAVYECEGSVELVLPDSACFKQMPHEQFELVKGCDAREATLMIRALLDKLGSPLAPTVEVPEEARLPLDAVTLTDVSARGVAAVISGERRTSVLLGDVSYLQRYGIHVSPKKDGRYEEIRRSMLCVAIGNRLTALFIARYRPEVGMQTLAEALEGEGVRLVIRSADPGIHDELLQEIFADADRAPCVIKPLAAESDLTAERVDATVVAVGSAREAAHTFVTCRRIRRAVRLGRAWQVLSLVLGAGLAAVFTFLGVLDTVPAFAVALYAFLWSGAHAMSAYFTLREKGEME